MVSHQAQAQRGQATIDYLALIALLALVLGAASMVVGGGAASIDNAVLGQLRRALCVVAGGACPAQRELPCVVAGDRDAVHVSVSLAIVRIDEDRVVLRERLSDGTVRLTLSTRNRAGVEGAVGARAQATLQGRAIGSEREARGSVEGVVGWGEVFLARDDRQADEILRSLRPRLPLVGEPRPREVFVEGGVRALARLGLGAGAAGASLDATADGIVGARRDLRSGAITISLGASSGGWALVSALMAAPSGSTERQAALAVTLDRRRRPIELSLTASGTLAAGAALLPSLAGSRSASGATTARMGGRRWELGARVDLRDRDVGAAWAAFRRDPANPAAVRALAAQLRSRAHLDLRSYALRGDFDGVAASVALGLRAGGELFRTRDRSRLLTAATRPPGGLWERRVDCVAA